MALLFAISWIMGLTAPVFTLLGHVVTGRDLVLLCGGLFLLAKATNEIHKKVEGSDPGALVPAPHRRDARGGRHGAEDPKGYVYFAMAFSLGVELLNMRFRAKRTAGAAG